MYRAIRPLLFRIDPESAHEWAFLYLRGLEALALATRTAPPAWSHPAISQDLWGLRFANPVGLAAGFDKNSRAPHVWPRFGFGFAELGTITARAQPGNPRPRLFRLPADEALINRLGFNNDGAVLVSARLTAMRRRLAPSVPLGINLGKSRVVPVDEAIEDYRSSLRCLYDCGDYFVINVSSPNTPGLRDLQQEEQLSGLAGAMAAENIRLASQRGIAPRPVLVKVAPDLDDDGLAIIVQVAKRHGLSGLIATNTTLSRAHLRTVIDQSGGLSGRPLRDRSTEVVATLRRLAGPELPIVGVGGVASAGDAYAKIRAGASLVQIYTGFIYGGPSTPRDIAAGLVELLKRDGLDHISQAVGVDV